MTIEIQKSHAQYSASGSERWLRCPGSIALCKNAPEGKESKYSLEGTQAHTCFEVFLKNGEPKWEASATFLKESNPEEMVDHAHQAAREIWQMAADFPGAEVHSERKVDLGFIGGDTPVDAWGTTDASIVQEFGRLSVFDFKYGAGIVVDVEANSQLAFYALGLAHEYDYNFVDVALVVIQPRAAHVSGETVRTAILTIDELKAWAKTFADGVKACEDPFADLTPGDHCRFCRGKVICPAVSDLPLKQAQLDFAPETKELVAPSLVSLFQRGDLSTILDAADQLEKWIDGVRTYAEEVLQAGGDIEGWKLVEKRAQRKWKDEEKTTDEAFKAFGARALSAPTLLSPAQLEKITKDKDWVAQRTVKESSGVTLARESDKRPAHNSLAVDFAPAIDVRDEQPADATKEVEAELKVSATVAALRRKPLRKDAKGLRGQRVKSKKKSPPKTTKKSAPKKRPVKKRKR